MEPYLSLDRLSPGECGEVCSLELLGGMRRRLQDLGLVIGTHIRCVGRSPMGDPAAFLIRGAVIALRDTDSRLVTVRPLQKELPWD